MYATAIILLIGATLLLGSWIGLGSVLLLVIAIALRAVQEETTLGAELSGSDGDMAKVKYHLIPYVW